MILSVGDRVSNYAGDNGVVTKADDLMVRVEFNNGRAGWFDRETLERSTVCPIVTQIDLSDWTRLPEVYAYADRRGIKLNDAIRELVNSGLGHQIDSNQQPFGMQH